MKDSKGYSGYLCELHVSTHVWALLLRTADVKAALTERTIECYQHEEAVSINTEKSCECVSNPHGILTSVSHVIHCQEIFLRLRLPQCIMGLAFPEDLCNDVLESDKVKLSTAFMLAVCCLCFKMVHVQVLYTVVYFNIYHSKLCPKILRYYSV